MFDMGLGMGMMAQGAIDMEIGAMDMAMGMPVLGAEMMAVGAMDMNMGAGLMEIGAMQTGMMMRGGLIGAEMMATERMMQAEVIGAEMRMMRGIGYCPVGCMDVCCRPVISPMVQTQYVNNQAIYQRQQAMNQQAMMQQQARMQQQAQMKMQIAQQQRLQQIRAQQQRLEQQRMMMQKQQLIQKEQALLQAKKIQQEKMMQQRKMEEQMMYQQNKMQRQQQQNMKQGNQPILNVNPYEQTISQQTSQYQAAQNNKIYQSMQKSTGLLYVGKVQQLIGVNWQGPVDAQLTADNFMNIKINSITKIKIKAESKFTGTRLIKITTMSQDHLFSVIAQEQIQWMSKIIWAKLNSMGKKCNLNDHYDGHIEGEIVKKSFFGDWQSKFGSISGPVFKISAALGSAPEKTIASVPQIWTRFEFVHGGMLVVKMHLGGRKLQIGIPVDRAIGWLRGLFYTIRL